MNPYQYSEYFNWLCSLVGCTNDGAFYPYKNLLDRLFQTPFEVMRYMDDNREVNGRMLRYYFESNHYDYGSNEQSPYHYDGDFYEETKDEPCSMLEMMIALAKDIDVGYLHSTTSRLFIWFWMMVESMGLACNVDGYWDNRHERSDVDFILHSFVINAHEDHDGLWVPTVKLFPIRNEAFEKTGSLWEQMQIWYNEQGEYLEDLSPTEYIEYFTCRYMYG